MTDFEKVQIVFDYIFMATGIVVMVQLGFIEYNTWLASFHNRYGYTKWWGVA